jgi:hypothetical protein
LVDSAIHTSFTFQLSFCKVECYQSLFLWHPSLASPLLLRYIRQWDSDVHFWCLYFGVQYSHCPLLLQLHPSYHL